jgi:hypothetical protein
MKTLKTLGITLFLLTTIMVFNSCSKKEAVTPAAPELSILGKWQLLVSRSTENGKSVYEYVGKPADYVEFTSTDVIIFMQNERSANQYKVIEKNKKITIIDSDPDEGDGIFDIKNLTNSSMTIYQEYTKNNIKYINYIDLKK